jgi:2-polyprenyl-6-methoxyphenol hydroxylase-like FAD-dependent oxidoreductase
VRALIAGSGVAGPATALFLRRTGWDVQILEASAEQDDGTGAFLNVATNGQAVLAELSLRARLLTDAHPAPAMVMWSGSGKRLGEVPNGPAGDPSRGGVVVRRGWLHRVLREAAEDAGVPIATGARVRTLEEGADDVTVHTADGRSFGADIVVGADGVGSAVRRHLDPAAPSPSYSGLVGLGGYAYGTGLAPTPGVQHFVFGRRSFFGYLVRDDGTVYWFANLTHPETGRSELAAVPAQVWLTRLRGLHRGDLHPVPEILAAAQDSVGAYGIYSLPVVPRWHRGRVVCVGDAVHAMSPSAGQGASIALEDAQVLAQCLRDTATTADGFALFDRLRRARAEAVVRHARTISDQKKTTDSRLAMAVRDLMLPFFLRRAATDASQSWLYDYHVDWDEPLDGTPAPAADRPTSQPA